ncbi:uncharacterized protein LOC132169808 [Corylus avellana]|uniref:uncharacterized protein LOC132169808 n=1 Tax=Corylus avellana TaxID=13451 RepID=UPI00286CBF39|nr:uncharacterized protein LOC132169808 [Corylus avellana]
MANKPLILRKWTPGMQLLKISLSSVPVWIKLHNLPIEYWNATCLSYVASGVGKPICADSVTEEQLRLGFARVLVEVDMNSVLPKEIEIVGVDGGRVVVGIEYPWLPVKCKKCKLFGHLSHTCTKVEKQVWLPKNTEPVQNLNAGLVVEKVAELKNDGPNLGAEPKWNVVRAKKTPVSKPTVKDNQSNWTNSFHLLARADGNFKSGVRGSDTFSSLQNVIESAMVEESAKIKGKGKMGEEEEGVDRRHLWSDLCSMKGKVGNNPWMICGDFNVVLSLAEKWGSDKLSSYEIEFGQCVNDLEVLDLNFSGCFYTWTNKSEEPWFVARKLDRVLANVNWMSSFGSTAVEFLSGGVSDHSPAIISAGSLQSFGPKPFKFYNFWLEHEGFLDWVKEGWSVQTEGFPMYQLYVKLRADSLLKERECLHAFVSITRAEESFLKQKARNQWLQLGDQNNNDVDQIKKVAEDFYKNLLGTEQVQFTEAKAARVRQLIPVAISLEHAAILEKEVTAEEIRDILFHMKANKAPGPDGFYADFFKSTWSIVGQEVVAAIKGFFSSGLLLKEVNATILSLVPKKVNPSAMGDFRPITCCNVIYKCITKILSNRMLPFLGNLVSMNQSAFIPSRSISENVLLAQELVRGYHKEKGNPRCTLKIDLMKAYDSVNWDFMLHCLHCFGFPNRFLSWIKECITSPKFSVCINGTLVGYFEGKKELRQGDPISPYLFVLAVEVFSRIMADHTSGNGGFKFHPKCVRMQLTHLCFADDLLIFSEASLSSIRVIKAALLEFENLSGLKANPAKSSFYCSGISDRLKHVLLEDLRMKEGHLPVRYLGVPLISSRLSSADCGALLSRISG